MESIILRRSPQSQDPIEVSQSTQYHTANDSDTVLHVSTGNDDTLCKEVEPFPGSVVGYEADEEEDAEIVDDLTPPKDHEDLPGMWRYINKLKVYRLHIFRY